MSIKLTKIRILILEENKVKVNEDDQKDALFIHICSQELSYMFTTLLGNTPELLFKLLI